jgi:TonB family protein
VVTRAIGLSLAVHALALAILAIAWPALRARSDATALAWAAWLGSDLAPAPPDRPTIASPPTEVELRAPGDVIVDVAHAGAPTSAPNPDPAADAAASSSGYGAGAPTAVTDRVDAATLRAQPYDAARGYQMQRARTDEQRRSREEVLATPHPEDTPWQATAPRGRGHGDVERRLRRVASTLPQAARDEFDRAPPREARDERAGFARPQVARDPAATDAAEPADDVTDRVQMALVSDERQPAKLELSRPTSPGAATSGHGPGALGYSPTAAGAAPVPTGAPNLPDARTLALATFQRAYDHYLSRVKQKVDPLWEFPRELALRMEQGDVLVGFTIRRDGSVRDLRVLKGSGFPQFDKNVLAAIKKAAPFEPLPETLGPVLHVTAPFEGANPAIR